MSVLAVIPARLASKRIPDKPLAPLRGRPLIEHVWRAASRIRGIDRLVVATDDARIGEAVEAAGGEFLLTDVAHPSGSDRVAEAARRIGGDAEIVVNLQGDEPLLPTVAVEQAIEVLRADSNAQMATLAFPETDRAAFLDRNVVKVVVDGLGYAMYFSRAPIGGGPEAHSKASFLRHIGIYLFRAPTLQEFAGWSPTPLERGESLEQLRALEHGLKMRVVLTSHRNRPVDTPEDLAVLERDWDRIFADPSVVPAPTDSGGTA